ncbi:MULTISPECIES: ATP-dependent metallopeptidase FtsH/Yme1/Tma family protein [Nostoc]|uniref:Peptidase M41 FtsH extracellular domain-containing protein n=1 Tax=Nostoc paludosum FACHB-159 TaxID=2692908 RepID=A0ABR8KQK2_9NOSO|nr:MULTISPECIES: ATP-dependent metallopeptidase FtsH/Yme1/Tma family protein [Nostoc]MBD2683648.1 hypothetical protein [Nostoc sp. FACHB-857]MBD2739913.1 hypothetical protein [Nostoc paludosum FACHB-159]
MKTETSSQSAYSKFIEQIKSSQVQRVTIKPDRIEYILKPEFGSQRYYTDPSGQIGDLKNLLQSHNVEIISLGDNSANAAGIIGLLLSSGILVGAFAWLLIVQKINSSSLFNAKFVAIKLNLALLVAYFMVHKLAHLMIQVTVAEGTGLINNVDNQSYFLSYLHYRL